MKSESYISKAIAHHISSYIGRQINKEKLTSRGLFSKEFGIQLSYIIMDGKQILTSHLTFILNECINESVFPTMLKRATITPIFKKDDILDPNNFRPISITTTFSKILEKFIRGQITAYIEEIIFSLHSNLVLGKTFQ